MLCQRCYNFHITYARMRIRTPWLCHFLPHSRPPWSPTSPSASGSWALGVPPSCSYSIDRCPVRCYTLTDRRYHVCHRLQQRPHRRCSLSWRWWTSVPHCLRGRIFHPLHMPLVALVPYELFPGRSAPPWHNNYLVAVIIPPYWRLSDLSRKVASRNFSRAAAFTSARIMM